MVSQLFDVINVFVLPFWTLMIFLPNWQITRKIMSSYLPFVSLSLAYFYLLVNCITLESAQALINPKLSDITVFFTDETATATGWVHFLALDLFMGRWVYWKGQQTGVWTVHSITLCLLAGPLGLLSHIITDWVRKTFFSKSFISETPTN